MPARPRHQRHYELASWELASWAAAKGVLVWQADVALATLELYAAAITPDSSALSHTWLASRGASPAAMSPCPTSSPSTTASFATPVESTRCRRLYGEVRSSRSRPRPKRTFLVAETRDANALRARRLAREPPNALAYYANFPDLGEATVPVEPLLFCLCSERLSTSLVAGGMLHERQAGQARAKDEAFQGYVQGVTANVNGASHSAE